MGFNILFILAGCILIGFGAWSQVDAKDYLNFLGDSYVNTPIFLMIVGGVIFLVAFLGCCGAWRESKCLIYTYAFFLAVILVAQIGAGIAAYMLKGDLDAEVVKNMNKGMENYEKPDFDGVTTTWDIVQNELHCCGVENSTDWANTRPDMFTAKTTTTTTQPTMDTQFLGQGGLLETLSSDHFDIENTASIDNNWMEVEMDLTNESTMSLFQIGGGGGGEGGGDHHQLFTTLKPHQPVRNPIGGAAGEDHHPQLSLQLHEQRHGDPPESH